MITVTKRGLGHNKKRLKADIGETDVVETEKMRETVGRRFGVTNYSVQYGLMGGGVKPH